MSYSLLEHSDNPFEIDGEEFGVSVYKEPIPNGPMVVTFILVERDSAGEWRKIDKWGLGTVEDELDESWDTQEEYEDAGVRFLKEKAAEKYV